MSPVATVKLAGRSLFIDSIHGEVREGGGSYLLACRMFEHEWCWSQSILSREYYFWSLPC